MSHAMTIARGLARMKTIKAQISNISSELSRYSASSNKVHHALGQQGTDIKTNHRTAKEYVASLWQQYEDLTKEFVAIKDAIDKANMTTTITVGGRTMTINQALIERRHLADVRRTLLSNVNTSINRATQDVGTHNRGLQASPLTEETKKLEEAQITYFLPIDRVRETDKWLSVFLTELNGELNATNALTEITIEN